LAAEGRRASRPALASSQKLQQLRKLDEEETLSIR